MKLTNTERSEVVEISSYMIFSKMATFENVTFIEVGGTCTVFRLLYQMVD